MYNNRSRPLRVAILCSRRAPALRYVLELDPHHGALYDIVACLTSEETFADEEHVCSHAIPVLRHPIHEFCQANRWDVSNPTARAVYDAITRRRLSAYDVDLVVLDTYLYRLSDPMLWAYPARILNVHHSDLSLRDSAGRARYPGLHAVRDAILDGAPETRASAHLVTRDVDEGPQLVRSWAFPVAPLVQRALAWNATDILKTYAYAHQEWMIRGTWGPLVAATLTLVASGRLNLELVSRMPRNDEFCPYELDETGTISPRRDSGILQRSRLFAAAG